MCMCSASRVAVAATVNSSNRLGLVSCNCNNALEAESTFTGGLLTFRQLRKHLPTTKDARPEKPSAEDVAAMQETVYRDASGRKIDTKAERAEAARKKREREERESKKMEWGKGIVQREEEEQHRRELERQRTKDVARYADDEELNKEQKERKRWNDPAAAFLTVCGHFNLRRLNLIVLIRHYHTEKSIKRSSETRIHGTTPTPQPIRHQTWI